MRALAMLVLIAATIILPAEGKASNGVRLLCRFKTPAPIEQNQSYLITVDFGKRKITSTQFVSGAYASSSEFVLENGDDETVRGYKNDVNGRPKQTIPLNRLTAEMLFGFLFYGAERESLWNDAKQRKGDFDQDPVTFASSPLICRNAQRQF